MTEKLNLSKRFDLILKLNFILQSIETFDWVIVSMYFMCITLSRCHDVTCDCLTMTPTQEARRII